ncbi:MAG: 50S ribosomal protein L11 methyltransferase [Candidatus Kerfeldbacteria bacterium]|nr:50S ribosomal protein L11 methyltransferase [Candidatus Kerfeldbacteria bacterium]
MIGSVLLILALVLLVTTAYAGISAAPWIPTRRSDIRRLLASANIQKGETVVDLGCGDGRLVIAADTMFGAHGIGYEISLIQYLHAQWNRWRAHAKNTEIRYKSLFAADLARADVVLVFLMARVYDRLRPKLERELKPGARVIVEAWPIPGWEPAKTEKPEGRLTVYTYVRPPRPTRSSS